jgi:hypothetical protein
VQRESSPRTQQDPEARKPAPSAQRDDLQQPLSPSSNRNRRTKKRQAEQQQRDNSKASPTQIEGEQNRKKKDLIRRGTNMDGTEGNKSNTQWIRTKKDRKNKAERTT